MTILFERVYLQDSSIPTSVQLVMVVSGGIYGWSALSVREGIGMFILYAVYGQQDEIKVHVQLNGKAIYGP